MEDKTTFNMFYYWASLLGPHNTPQHDTAQKAAANAGKKISPRS